MKIRDTMYVAIPVPYVEAAGITKGAYMEIRVGQDGSLMMRKEKERNA